MTSTEADFPNSAFLKSFYTETLYLVQEDKAGFAAAPPAAPESSNTESPAPATPDIPSLAKAPTKPAAALKTAAPFAIAGGNLKGVVVLVTLQEEEFKVLPQQEFLRKILQAIGLSPADVAFVNNISGKNAQLEDLMAATDVNYIISFASRIDTAFPHDKFTLYKPVVVEQVPIVFSQSLAVLDKDQEQKKLLWNTLKQVFI